MQSFTASVPSPMKFVHRITRQPTRNSWISERNLRARETAHWTTAANTRTPWCVNCSPFQVPWTAKRTSPYFLGYSSYYSYSSYFSSTSSSSTGAVCPRTRFSFCLSFSVSWWRRHIFNYGQGQLRRGTFLFSCFAICSHPVNLRAQC